MDLTILEVHLVCGSLCFRAGKKKHTENSHVESPWCFVGTWVSPNDDMKNMWMGPFVAKQHVIF